jgi:hypothetical protein
MAITFTKRYCERKGLDKTQQGQYCDRQQMYKYGQRSLTPGDPVEINWDPDLVGTVKVNTTSATTRLYPDGSGRSDMRPITYEETREYGNARNQYPFGQKKQVAI